MKKKFIYSEKAAKFCEISTVDLSYVGDFAKFCGLLSIYEGVEILFSYRTSVSKINGHKFYLKLYCKIWDYFWGKRRFYYLKIREVISSNKSAIQLNSSHPLASLLPVTFWSDEPKYLHCLWVLIESLLLMLYWTNWDLSIFPQITIWQSKPYDSKTEIIQQGTDRHEISTAKKILERLGIQTSSLFVKIWYIANVLTIKTTGTGNCRGPAGKICTIYGKGL